ncbi:MAG: hypothetical protein WAS33_02045 [Candidatus Promineifilaceae bacterium]|nr:hypothetical protein [Anaerolineaceae bacterium]
MSFSLFSPVSFGRFWQKKATILGLLLLVLLFGAGTAASSNLVTPTISITSVARGESVTFQTANYPAGQTFTVRMGKMGTQGIGGIVVGSLNSGNGGSMSASFDIPEALQDEYQIAIRLDSNLGYYSFNWFYNNTTTGSVPNPGSSTGYTGIPTFKVTAVTAGEDVTITTDNFPANMTFTVTMGKMYTRGIGGIVVGSMNSGEGGTLTATFDIPAALASDGRIAIRAQTAHANPYYAYNWFYNNTTNDGSSSGNGATGGGDPIYTGIPTFTVCTVSKDSEITILTKNFPTNQAFTVTMGPMYTQGIGGTVVGTLDSGTNSSARYTFPIPDGLNGAYRISVRTQTGHLYPYYSYNWFYNNSTTMDHCN